MRLSGLCRADEKDATAILDKAIKAMGGEEKLSKIKAYSVKTKGTLSIMGNDNDFTATRNPRRPRPLSGPSSQSKFGDNDFKAVAVVNGDKGWRKFGDRIWKWTTMRSRTRSGRSISRRSRPCILPAKSKGFKTETAGEEKVGDKPAAVVKVTGPDGKDFKLYFDKESGLPVKLVATVVGFDGNEFTQEMTYENYKEFDGIKRATKVEAKRDGEKFISSELVEFKVLDKVEPDTFSQPK